MWFILEDIQPRCIVCKKPIDPETKYSNMLLETSSGNFAELHMNLPEYNCCDNEYESQRSEIAAHAMMDWAGGTGIETCH